MIPSAPDDRSLYFGKRALCLPAIDMLISDRHKFIFVHNPKAAGHSIAAALGKYANLLCRHNFRQLDYYTGKLFGNVYFLCNYPMHISARDLHSEIPGEKWDAFLKFGVVRNPYDRAASFFYYLYDKPSSDKYKLFRSLGNFHNYILHLKNQNFKETQKYYFADENGRLLMDRIIHFENLPEEFGALTHEMGLPDMKLPRLNARPVKNDFRQYLDPEILEIMNEIYHDDFELFGYDKIKSL